MRTAISRVSFISATVPVSGIMISGGFTCLPRLAVSQAASMMARTCIS